MSFIVTLWASEGWGGWTSRFTEPVVLCPI